MRGRHPRRGPEPGPRARSDWDEDRARGEVGSHLPGWGTSLLGRALLCYKALEVNLCFSVCYVMLHVRHNGRGEARRSNFFDLPVYNMGSVY